MSDSVHQLFLDEAQELLQIMEVELLELKANPDIPALMRAAHTLKGSGAMVGLTVIPAIAHRLEDVFAAVVQQSIPVDEALESLLLQAYDQLERSIIAGLRGQPHDEALTLTQAEPMLVALDEWLTRAAERPEMIEAAGLDQPAQDAPAAEGIYTAQPYAEHTAQDHPITGETLLYDEAWAADPQQNDVALPLSLPGGTAPDIVTALFNGDVVAGLETLAAALQEDVAVRIEVLRSQLDAFVGIGELTGLPGFSAIAQAGLTALDCRPSQSEAIGACVLKDLRTAHAIVLAGERDPGGQPSETLLAFGVETESRPTAQILPPDAASEAPLSDAPLNNDVLTLDDSTEEAMLLALFGEADPAELTDAEPVPSDPLGIAPPDPEFPETLTAESSGPQSSDLESSDLESLDSASLDPEPLVNESSVPEPLPIPAAPPAAPQNRADQVSAAAESDVPAEAAEPDELDSALDALEEMLDESAPPVPAKASSTDPVRIPVSGLSRPIKSGLPKALIAKLAALLDSAPPEAVVHRQSDPSQRSAPPIPTTPDLKSAKTPRSKTVRVGLDRIKRINTLFGELVTYENKGSLQAQQLQHVIGSMTQRFRNFERITRSLQDWADQSQQDRSRLMASAANDGGFDALQMDSYDDVHLLMQEVMEEIAQLGEAIHDMTAINQQGQQVNRQKQQTLRQIRNDLIRTSMMPMGDLLRHFPRMVRDMSTKFNKTVKMVVDGGDTLVDRTVFEKLYDPLVHLVRNAFDHGIETPGMRVRLNKPAEATISLRAYSKSHQTYLEISDDGRGISLDRVRQKAIEQGLYSTEEAAKLSSDQLYDCLFHPGFSTASAVSELSGRGVGLDVVATQLKQLKGAIKVISVPNRGTTFVLRFPLSLNVAELMVFSVGSRTFAIAMDTVKTILSVATEDITIGDETPFYRWQGQSIPLYPRSTLLNHYPLRGSRSRDSLPAIPLPKDGKVPLIVIAAGNRTLALQVDSILQAQELTIKPFGIAIQPPNYLLGCTTLGNGSLIPVVDGQALVARYFEPPNKSQTAQPQKLSLPKPTHTVAPSAQPTSPADVPTSPIQPQTILVIDDSLTARQVLVFTLEKAGYQTLQAKDGRDAIEQLSRNFAEICAVFCDVEMPRMNGFEFLSQCRQGHGNKTPPVIMLTSRSGDKHRKMGESLGASAYLTKPYLEQALIQTLTECLQTKL